MTLKRLLCLALLLAAGHASAAGVTLSGIVLLQDGESTKALIDLSGPADYKTFTLKAPDRAVLDIDNRAKAVLDACTKGGLWDDDSQVDVLTIRRGCVLKGGAVVVRARECEAVPEQAELPLLVSRETEDLWA